MQRPQHTMQAHAASALEQGFADEAEEHWSGLWLIYQTALFVVSFMDEGRGSQRMLKAIVTPI
jgi:hypothetical protein